MKTTTLKVSDYAAKLRALSKQLREVYRNKASPPVEEALKKLEAESDSLDLTFNTVSNDAQFLVGVEVQTNRISELLETISASKLQADKLFLEYRSTFESLIKSQ